MAFASPAAATEPAGFSREDRADANCLAVASVALGRSVESGTSNSPEAAGITSVLTYYLGKLKGRHPALQIADVITPDFYAALTPIFAAEARRCGAEAIAMGSELEQAGKILTAAANAATKRGNGT